VKVCEKLTLNLLEALLQGTRKLAAESERAVDEVSASYGLEISVSYPGTIYNLPIIYGLTGRKISSLKDVKNELFIAKSSLSKPIEAQGSGMLGQIALTCVEIVEALNYLGNKQPEKPCVGFVPDVVFRELSLGLADGTIPGIVGVAGVSAENGKLKKLLSTIKERNLLCLLMGPVLRQAQELGFELGLNSKLIPIGYRLTTIAHFMNLLIRAPLMFGGIVPGRKDEILDYLKERVPAFLLYLGKPGEAELAVVNGVSSMNIPMLTDQSQLSALENVHYQAEYSIMVEKGCELKGIKIKRGVKPEVPVDYGPMYEGEKIRREDMYVEFGGRSALAFEIVRIAKPSEVVDGAVNLQGPDLEGLQEGSSSPLGVIVKLAGAGLEEELEPVLERRIHQFLNQCQGVMHLGQRSEVWIRVSKDAVKSGLKLKHIGNVLYTMFHSTFPQLVEKVEVRLLTDQDLVMKEREEAESAYAERDERLRALKEEEVDSFYGCTLCQSFAPTHVCVITPERVSLCGSTSWLDARISHKLDPSGPNFKVPKGQCLDAVKGEWSGVNETVRQKSKGSVKRVFLHSLFGYPHTSCGCFQAIAFYIPEVDGIGIVHRGFKESAINGMPFTTMAGFCGGGRQVEGFLGIGLNYVKSDKFLRADGGVGRVVWMPLELKLRLKEAIPKDLFEKIATEHDVKTLEELRSFLKSVDHPVTRRWRQPSG